MNFLQPPISILMATINKMVMQWAANPTLTNFAAIIRRQVGWARSRFWTRQMMTRGYLRRLRVWLWRADQKTPRPLQLLATKTSKRQLKALISSSITMIINLTAIVERSPVIASTALGHNSSRTFRSVWSRVSTRRLPISSKPSSSCTSTC